MSFARVACCGLVAFLIAAVVTSGFSYAVCTSNLIGDIADVACLYVALFFIVPATSVVLSFVCAFYYWYRKEI